MSRRGTPVYSTAHGRLCARCGRPQSACACRSGPAPPRDGVVRVARETKGRKGKGVTVITGVPLESEALAALAKELKQKCGSGGRVRGALIEIQGDHRDRLVEELSSRGWTVKRSGG